MSFNTLEEEQERLNHILSKYFFIDHRYDNAQFRESKIMFEYFDNSFYINGKLNFHLWKKDIAFLEKETGYEFEYAVGEKPNRILFVFERK